MTYVIKSNTATDNNDLVIHETIVLNPVIVINYFINVANTLEKPLTDLVHIDLVIAA